MEDIFGRLHFGAMWISHTHQTDQKSQVADHIQLDSFYEIFKKYKTMQYTAQE